MNMQKAKAEKRIFIFSAIILFGFISLVMAAEFTPQGNINLQNIYGIINATNISTTNLTATNISSTYFSGNGSGLTNVVSSVANSSTFWGSYEFPSSISYLVLSKWANITNAPTILSFFTDDILWTIKFNSTGDSRWVNLAGDTMTGNLNMGDNNINNINNINITNNTYIYNLRSFDENSINVQPTGDEDDYFSFKTLVDRPTIKREGGKFIYFESSNVYDVGISFRKDDDYSGTLNYEKDNYQMTLLGKNSSVGIKTNSEYSNYILFETINHQPQISVFNGSTLDINDSLEVNGNLTADVFYGDVKIDTINGQTYNYLQDWIDTTQSAGKVSGGTMTDNGDGTVNISSGSGFIKVSDSAVANTILFDWDINTSVPLTDGVTNYIYVDYNSGNPMIKSALSKVNNRDKILLGKVFREGTNAHTYEAGMLIAESAKNILGRFTGIDGEFKRESGMVISETGTLNLASTSGYAWGGLTRISVSAVDTSGADTFEYYYYNGTDWLEDTKTQINNTYYNNPASGLVELTPNRYGVHWVYIDNDADMLVVYGQGDYTLLQAESSQPPSSLPAHVSDFSVLIGRVIVQKGDTSFTDISSAFDIQFTGSAATEHSSLTQLDFASSGHTGFAKSADCPTGQFVQNTTDGGVECAAPAGVGTVTSIATTAPISGGIITSTGTISLDTATPSNGDTTHASTADQIYDWVISLSYVANAIASLVEDTTPQLGGYLDTNGQNIGSIADEIENIYVATDSRIYFGNGQEASMYYNGTALIISN